MTPEPLNLVPFALPNTPPGEIRFEDPRDISRIVVEFASNAPGDIGVSYLHKRWPEVRLEEVENPERPAPFGWAAQDDWFNVAWQKASVQVSREGAERVALEFRGLTSEFPELTGYDVTFRRTLGIRIDVADAASIKNIAVFSVSPPTRTQLRVELAAGLPTPGSRMHVEGYNADIEAVVPLHGVTAAAEGIRLGSENPRQFAVSVRHVIPSHRYGGDDGLVTFVLDDDAFTISLTSLHTEGPIWSEDFGVFITKGDDPTGLAEYRARTANARTITQRVAERPEQTFAGAYHGQPRPHAVSYNLGCPLARQRFWLEPNGDLLLNKQNVTWVKGKDTDRFKCRGSARFFFGLEHWHITARFPDPEPVLAYNISARRGGVTVEQKSFAVPLLTSLRSGHWSGDDPMAALVRFHFRNDSAETALAELPLSFSQDSRRSQRGASHIQGQDDNQVPLDPRDQLTLSGHSVMSDWDGQPALRCTFQTSMDTRSTGQMLTFSRLLQPGENCEVILKIPFITLEANKEIEALDGLEFEQCYEEVTAYWQDVGQRGAQVATPEPQLATLHRAHVPHVLVTDFAMPDDGDLINTSVGTSTYGNFSNEACMIVHDLDQRGLHEDARRRLAVWLKYQGTVPQPGNFTDYNGMFYGAGGFECGAYNQHHGWVLWCLCEHFFLTRDREWLNGVADAVIAGADWVFRQRRNTMAPLPHSRGWERGFLPAGSLEDVTDFYYWLSTNSLTWRGTEWAARALEAIGHADAARIRREADAYGNDLRRGFDTMRRRSPLVRLRDGRWVPHYPSRMYRRGREVGWIRETLEGAVYLLISGLCDPNGREARWILGDYQDNRYVRPPYGYFIEDFETTWFDRAGISIQPNLLAGLMPHLDRDEPEIYIWMFYNAWCACYREEINAMVEHPMPVLGYSNAAHFKTSDQANAMTWLRYMFVYATDGLLHFGRAIPRAWFGQPEPFEAQNVVTRYGKVGVRYERIAGKDAIRATASLELKESPPRILVRFRDPDKREIRAVRVNGTAHPCADSVRGDIDITGQTGLVEIEAEWGQK